MELFKFNFDTAPTVLEQGEAINGATSTMWVERYSEPGDFELVSPLSSGLREFLPIGTLISHADTLEVMIVENHEIKENPDNDPILTITGRTFDSYLENRVVGMNQCRASTTIFEAVIGGNYTWHQVVGLINDHIVDTEVVHWHDSLVNVFAYTGITGTGEWTARIISRGNLAEKVRELLAIDDLGIRTVRRNTFGGYGSDAHTTLDIYTGVNRSANVIFSWKSGDLDSADYLFSNKKLKNSALVQGRFCNIMVDLGPIQYDRRMMIVDAADIDEKYSTTPTGADLTAVIDAMRVRGQQALMSQKDITISRADISNVTKYHYRKDYNVGDLVSLDGNFGQIAVMRVIEFVEIEDENGESGHPTLSVPGA